MLNPKPKGIQLIGRDMPAGKWPELEPWQVLYVIRGVREVEELLRKDKLFKELYGED